MGVEYSVELGKHVHKCRMGHHLNYNTSSDGYMGGMFNCDLCKCTHSCGEGRWNCQWCKWDVCNNCASQYKPKPNPISTCSAGHMLNFTNQSFGYPSGSYACDMCHRTFPCSCGRWNCSSCQYDICSFCRPPTPGPMPGPMPAPMPMPMPGPYPSPYPAPMPGPMPGPYPSPYPAPMPGPMPGPYGGMQNTCPMGHQLYDTNADMGYPNGMYTCDRCHQTFSCMANSRFCCLECRYDVCKGCKPY